MNKNAKSENSDDGVQISGEYGTTAVYPRVERSRFSTWLGLIATDEGESQDLCFLPDGDFADFVLKRFPDLQKPGSILDSNGKVLGVHQGAFRYTRGQRKGLGLGGGPWFVLQTDLQKNTVTIGHAEETLAQTVSLAPDTMNWLIPSEQRPKPGQPLNCTAQIRYRMRAKNAVLLDNTLSFTENISAVTPGQLAVCYRDDQVIASGFIL